MAHAEAYPVKLGDRGQFVIPAQIRKRLKLGKGDDLLITVQPDGTLRLTSPRQAIREIRGLYRARARHRSLVDELLSERRAGARQETIR